MTSIDDVTDLTPRVQYVASAAQTTFDYPFPIFEDTDLVVDIDGTTKTLTTDYTVTGAGANLGGTVVLVVAATGGEIVTIYRDITSERTTDYQQNGPLDSSAINDELDRLTLVDQQLQERINRTLRLPITAAVTDADIELTVANWANKYLTFDSVGKPTPAAIASTTMTQATIGGLLYPRTTAEIAASVTPTNYYYEPGNVLRYGADASGVSDSTAAIQRAINSDHDVVFPSGTYLAAGLTQTNNFQNFRAEGWVRVKKNANGAIITSSGDDVEFNGIGFAGDAASPTYTGDGVVLNGDNARLINCGCRWISGVPVVATGDHAQIVGTCDIYQTTDSSATGYDIVIGVSGTATLYHKIIGIKTSQADGGIKFIDTGSAAILGSQFGKLTVAAGTSPAGTNGGNYSANRILGDVTVSLSNSAFSANTFGTIGITLDAGTSGHFIDDSNVFSSGATITDSSSNSRIVDTRKSVLTSYTPSWTGAVADPAIGNGSITGYYTKLGRQVDVSVRIVMGSTTTFGTGGWYISLPFTPNSSIPCIGTAILYDATVGFYTGLVQSLTDGTSRLVIYAEGGGAQVSSAVPFTWTTSDEVRLSLSYWAAA